MPVDIQATFSKDEKPRNGLEAIIADLEANPLEERYAVVKFIVSHSKVDHLKGDAATPVVKFTGIEPVLSQADEEDAERLYTNAYQLRTGQHPQDPLPKPGQPALDDDSDDDGGDD